MLPRQSWLGDSPLELWDDNTGKWVLYKSEVDHSHDCKLYPFESVPSSIFLDTCVVNLLVKFSETIFELEPIPLGLSKDRSYDIQALMHLMQAGARANWVVTTSPAAINELERTPNPQLREALTSYGREFLFTHDVDYAHANDLGQRSVHAPFLAGLKDDGDRELVGNAVGLGCDVFCTSDRSTIVRVRDALIGVPVRIMTPVEWWRHFKPWAGLVL